LCKPVAPTGFDITRLPSLNSAIQRLLERHYRGIPLPSKPVNYKTPTKVARNDEIRDRFANGETIADLARDYDLTDQRVFQIIHSRNK
jgi:hypothetical protein